MFDHLFELPLLDDSNKWSNIGFSEEKGIIDIRTGTLFRAPDKMRK